MCRYVFDKCADRSVPTKGARVIVVVLSLITLSLLSCAKQLEIPGNEVSSGEFYDFIMHKYTIMLPPSVEARDIEKMYTFPLLEKCKVVDEYGNVESCTNQKQRRKKQFVDSLTKGEIWNVTIKIEKITMTDATHGAVLFTYINDWMNESRTQSGRYIRRRANYWEKIEGQWRLVFAELGPPST